MNRRLLRIASVVLGIALLRPGPSLAAAGDTLRVMTYNIYYGGQDHDPVFGRDEEWLDVIRSRDPDLLFVEEANGWLPAEQNYLAAYVESLNASFPGEAPYEGYIGQAPAFHVALLSRIPVVAFEAFGSVQVDTELVDINHVFIHATLDLGGKTAHAVGVHFKSGAVRADREREARALLTILEGIPLGETVFIGGDFNSYSPVDIVPGSGLEPDYAGGALPAETKGWEPVGYLLNQGYYDSYRIMNPASPGYTQNTTSFLPSGMGSVQRVDFLLRSPGSTWRLESSEVVTGALGDVGSDHYAVFAKFVDTPWVGTPDAAARARGLRVFPQPMAGGGRIAFSLRRGGEARVSVYSPAGRRVRTLSERSLPAGTHEVLWDGTGDDGRALAPGVYFVRVESGLSFETARLVWLGATR